jgi:hypothetical protein
LAAQAYSPSDAMSQARFCLDGMRKVQRGRDEFGGGHLPAETGPGRRRICSGGRGGPPDFPRRRRPRRIAPCGGVVWLGRAARHMLLLPAMPERLAGSVRAQDQGGLPACGLLFPAGWIWLPRRHVGPRRRVRPDRLRQPRGLRGAAEAQQPWERGAMLLKHRHGGGGGEGNLYMHVVMHSARILTDSSGETASTSKIVSDIPRVSICGWTDKR